MDVLIVIGIGIVFCICASFVWHSDNDQPIKRVPSQRADELPILPKTEDIQTYQDNVCKKCPYFDSYDMYWLFLLYHQLIILLIFLLP